MNPFVRGPYAAAAAIADAVSALAGRATRVVPSSAGKLQRSLAARAGVLDRVTSWSRKHRSPCAPLVWIHAASVGEGLMARPVIDRIRAERPDVQLAYTFFSPSAETFAQSVGADITDYLPFDTGAAAQAMLHALTPSVILFSKLDVWPVLVEAATSDQVRLVLTSAALSESSGRRSALAQLLLRDAYRALDAVGAVHADDAARLVALGVRADRITVTGDVRYDQAWERASARRANRELLARLQSDRPTITAGSTWPGDAACLFDAWPAIRTAVPRARLIIAAHEPTAATTQSFQLRTAQMGLTAAVLDRATSETDVIIVDTVGVLADLYALATIAFVGGGFHSAGLHSVVEPAAFGAPVFVGPRHTASRDAMTLLQVDGGFAVTSGAELSAQAIPLLTDPETRTRAGKRARDVVTAGLGAAVKSAALILPLLKPLRLSR
ncbi:3-deoxy-D-manno-octulosonic acid transferase [Gemmatimonadota bacterium]|nr:3-deoxy-D-manno-octulosonic acid transferase [Gemmatimonadota bacterium]